MIGELWQWLVWIAVGAVAGWLTGVVIKGSGYGCIGNVIVGAIGSLVGGFIFRFLGIWPGGGFPGSVLTAFIGAVLFIGLLRLLTRDNR
jgi:uncharacterized membrane protein YeaQ/YmgE (transglycosylase-associated protein family)